MDKTATCFALIATILQIGIRVNALIGYDCGGEGLNITSLSLTDISECHVEDMEPETKDVYLQLMQFNEFGYTEAIQCRIEIDRTIYRCGMFSHVSAVSNGRRVYNREISRDHCKKAQELGTIFLGNNALIDSLKRNATTAISLTFAGTLANDGGCQGTTFSDPYGTWDNVIVQASVKITLKNFLIPIKLSANEVILHSGIRCKATDQECYDADGTVTYWKMAPKDSCDFNRYDVLYEGPAHKLTPPAGQDKALTLYTVTTNEATFALAKTSESNLCGFTIIHTEHPKLFLLETVRDRTFKTKTNVAIENFDMFTYVNSKFVYIEKHMKNQLTRMYRDIMEQKCALERQVLENALSLSSIAPDEMAHRLMKSPGYTAVAAGEVLYIIKCIPVTCKIRQTERCYGELPVTYNNMSYFLTPRSRILSRTGTPRECNEVLPPMYHIQDTWFRMMPRPVESMPPPVIRPLTKPKWKYIDPSNLATSGIYSTEDLERLRNHILFPVEKPAMLNTIAHGAMGGNIPAGTVSLYNMLDEESLEKIAESAGERLWKGFITFGSASAGVLAIFLIARLVKLIVDSVIRGYAIHSIYGWSIHLIGAVWSSITHLLIHLGGKRQSHRQEEIKRDDQVREVLVQCENTPSASGSSLETQKEGHDKLVARDYGELNKYLSSAPTSL